MIFYEFILSVVWEYIFRLLRIFDARRSTDINYTLLLIPQLHGSSTVIDVTN